ncbi:alpha/beta hydrolase [Streptomyces sp. SID14515]|uniref:alpha/beta fold hydrolase n=1 Tax=Streptomyces sp. SID14515 TaxID=2706074 RepID=UPI0013CCEED4|nr:alpha/beta hydrolase [Streptomyces sp. SID14515]NEB42190.1 alpha/beta hydrolase [Streptomyces sp. SID14515]
MKQILLLHGLGNNGAIWSRLQDHWRDDVRVHAPDLPWRSDGIDAWRYETDSASRVEEVISAVPGGPDVVVAHSFTVLPLLELLGRRALSGEPAGLSGIVLVTPFYRRDPDDFHWNMIAPLLANFPETMSEGIRLQSGDRPIDPDLRADMARRLCEWIGPYGWLRFFDAYLNSPRLRPDLITVPGLVIGAEGDATAPVGEARLLAADLAAGEALVLPEGGHFPMLEHPRWFTGSVQEFLDRTAAGYGPASPTYA